MSVSVGSPVRAGFGVLGDVRLLMVFAVGCGGCGWRGRGAGGAEAPSLEVMLAEALEANRRLPGLAGGLAEENARLRARGAEREAEFERMRADLAVLQRMLFGRSSEKTRPEAPGSGDSAGDGGSAGGGDDAGPSQGVKRGPGARAGRRDYPHLPRAEVTWGFPGGACRCPECGELFSPLGSHLSGEQPDWQVSVRVVGRCRRRSEWACGCRVPATVMAPGPPKAAGRGLFSNGFIAMLLTERFAAGRSMNSLVTGLSRQGAELSAGTLAGTCAQAAGLPEPLAGAIAVRNRESWHLHADEATWRVFAPRDGDGPAKWWLWAFTGPDTVAFVMDPSRSGQVLARHAGIGETAGQLSADEDGGPRGLVISSDFYAVYQSAGKKAGGLVNLYCRARLRRHFVRAGDASPVQLKYRTEGWPELIRALYAAHDGLAAAWQENAAPAAREEEAAASRLEAACAARDGAAGATRKKQAQAPGLQEPAKKALATLDRERDGLAAHRGCPMLDLDSNKAERTIRGPAVTRKNAGGSRNGDSARNAAAVWTVTATAQMAGLNIITYLTAYLDECGRNGGKPPAGPALERFLPWNASPEDLATRAQPPPPG